jgi:hypothetical protein
VLRRDLRDGTIFGSTTLTAGQQQLYRAGPRGGKGDERG